VYQLRYKTGDFQPQVQDFNGETGIIIAPTYNVMRADNNGAPFPLGAFDHISDENFTISFEYSLADEFDIADNPDGRDTTFKLNISFLGKYETDVASQDIDDPLQPSGIMYSLNSKLLTYSPTNMNLDTSQLPTLVLVGFRPSKYTDGDELSFYASNTFNHTSLTTQGHFPYNRSGKHTIAFGYRTKADGKYFFTYHDRETYFEKRMTTQTDLKMIKNRHLPLFTIYDGGASYHHTVVMKKIKIYNRFLEAIEIPERVDRFPFLYHFVTGLDKTYVNHSHANITRVREKYTHVQYLQFNDSVVIYANIVVGVNGLDLTSPVIWYEYEMEVCSTTSTFALEFFNVYD
jgi:hypothetical protein